MSAGSVKSVLTVSIWVIMVIWMLVQMVDAQKGMTICDVPGCKCNDFTVWKTVNCNLHDNQELDLHQGHLPTNMAEIFVVGGRAISFNARSFSSMPALSLLKMDRVNQVIVEPSAFYNNSQSSLHVKISGCDNLVIRSGAFQEMMGTLEVEISKIQTVWVGESPFSKLLNCTFQDIADLRLDQRAFEIRNLPILTSNERHGPTTVVQFLNVEITSPLVRVFQTVLAEVTFQDSRVGNIEPKTFNSQFISAVRMINSTFKVIMSEAFTQKTQIDSIFISNCKIVRLQSRALMAAVSKLTVNFSKITDIESNAVTGTLVNLEIIGNQIRTIYPAALNLNTWLNINIEQNFIENLQRNFIEAPVDHESKLFTFKANDIINLKEGSLSFVHNLDNSKLDFDGNYFKESCSCELPKRIASLTNNSTDKIDNIISTSFCLVDKALAKCFSMDVGVINMLNFTELACKNHTVCEPYNGEIKVINTTNVEFEEDSDTVKQTWLIVIVCLIGFFIIALLGTFVGLVIRGGRWLKRKGYFRNNYYHNESHEEEQNTIVTIDTEAEKLEIPEELTIEFLHELSRRLDDPSTHQEASEMIERLYEMFIVDDSYENNNREEDQHLYEELSNLNQQIPPPPYEEHEKPQSPILNHPQPNSTTGPRGILKLMEEKIYNGTNEGLGASRPTLNGVYSEPTDAAIHLYSELKQNQELKKNSVTSNSSLRQLPNGSGYLFEAGPSSKM